MDGKAMEKVPNGKLLKVKVTFSDKIEDIKILGDFFAYPENSIDDIEKIIIGYDLDFDSEKLVLKIEKRVKDKGYELIGIDPESIVKVLCEALR